MGVLAAACCTLAAWEARSCGRGESFRCSSGPAYAAYDPVRARGEIDGFSPQRAVKLTRSDPPVGQLAALLANVACTTRAIFGGLLLDSFLNGSYPRRTAVQPIKDVDIIGVVDTDWMKDDPGRAMESLRRKLAQRYDRYRTRHSVRRLVHSRGSGRLRMAARPRWRARATHFNVKATPRGTPAISTEGAINAGECGPVSWPAVLTEWFDRFGRDRRQRWRWRS